MTIKLSLHFDH